MRVPPPQAAMRRQIVATCGGRPVLALDTIAHVAAADAGSIVITGSHGGLSSGEYAARAKLAAVFFNDAGIGKDRAGVASLPWLDGQGVLAGAIGHDGAMIGDAVDGWINGTVTVLNETAERAGFAIGEPLRAAVERVFGRVST